MDKGLDLWEALTFLNSALNESLQLAVLSVEKEFLVPCHSRVRVNAILLLEIEP
jgi:hypothetical protein